LIVNTENFKVKDFPEFNPVSQAYDRMAWWKKFKRRCIEGYWVSGKWMPGQLYFYANAWNIRIESKKR